jgi:hypothetical protein
MYGIKYFLIFNNKLIFFSFILEFSIILYYLINVFYLIIVITAYPFENFLYFFYELYNYKVL